jgi:hypothetical protein
LEGHIYRLPVLSRLMMTKSTNPETRDAILEVLRAQLEVTDQGLTPYSIFNKLPSGPGIIKTSDESFKMKILTEMEEEGLVIKESTQYAGWYRFNPALMLPSCPEALDDV